MFLYTETPRANGVQEVIASSLKEIKKRYKESIVVPYKIELADVPKEDLLDRLPEILERIKTEHYYLLDLDTTQDFAGVFKKREMEKYFIRNFNFKMEGNVVAEDYDEEESLKVICKNDNTVGIDCLRWNTDNSSVKIYNNFVCQITSPGVTKTLGNHIINFVKCPDKRLR